MSIERYRYQGNWGIVFHVNRFIVQPADRGNLYNSLYFCEARAAQYKVTQLIVQLYDKMLAQERPCLMMVAFSQPLTREQGDLLNNQRTLVSNLTSSAFGAMGAAIPSGLAQRIARGVIWASTSKFVGGKLPTYHASDVIVSLVAVVDGGIGPQQSSSSMILKSGEYGY
ncbi:hypothetical protein HX776_15300 [Pseudomonas agarici]|uniref:hypothetical protein n=1 Tax=Pseudomonas agarici TaxID=46677 RepID=UPI00035E030A|nr:hypothetical protein [Pseudomonas agarici]NWC10173.1 hypothetical protein [Pseudomonas agarici]SEK18300.1 hypothetical protein SAMN05216604_10130 [Pseudomonas agarici]